MILITYSNYARSVIERAFDKACAYNTTDFDESVVVDGYTQKDWINKILKPIIIHVTKDFYINNIGAGIGQILTHLNRDIQKVFELLDDEEVIEDKTFSSEYTDVTLTEEIKHITDRLRCTLIAYFDSIRNDKTMTTASVTTSTHQVKVGDSVTVNNVTLSEFKQVGEEIADIFVLCPAISNTIKSAYAYDCNIDRYNAIELARDVICNKLKYMITERWKEGSRYGKAGCFIRTDHERDVLYSVMKNLQYYIQNEHVMSFLREVVLPATAVNPFTDTPLSHQQLSLSFNHDEENDQLRKRVEKRKENLFTEERAVLLHNALVKLKFGYDEQDDAVRELISKYIASITMSPLQNALEGLNVKLITLLSEKLDKAFYELMSTVLKNITTINNHEEDTGSFSQWVDEYIILLVKHLP